MWNDLSLGLWLSRQNGVVVKYDFSASGSDPIFKGGVGVLTAAYQLKAVTPQPVEPVQGCEVEWPLPKGVKALVRLPGIVSFETALSAEETLAFYQSGLAAAGWAGAGEPSRNNGAIAASYVKGNETVDLGIEPLAVGVRVKLVKTGQ